MLPRLTKNNDIQVAIDADTPFECAASKLRLLPATAIKENGIRSLCNSTVLQELFVDQLASQNRVLGEILKHAKQLQRLHSTSMSATDAQLLAEGLAHNTTLKRLFLGTTNDDYEFWGEVCGSLYKNTSLEELALSDVRPASCFERLKTGLMYHPTLHTLQFYWSYIAARALADLLQHSKRIATVYLYCCKFDDLTALLNAIESSRALTSLTVDCRMDDSLPLINAVKHHSTLTTLHLTSMFSGTNSPHFGLLMHALCTNTTLTSLGLKSNAVTDPQLFAALRDMLKTNTSITHLDLSYCRSGEAYSHVAEALAVNTTLQKLEISCFYHHDITDAQCQAIAEALKNNDSLTDLSIMLGTPGTNALCSALVTNRALKSLKIDVVYLKDSFNELCNMLAKNTALTSLNLDYRDFMPGHKLLSDALLVNKVMKKLTLTCSPVAFEHLCAALKRLPQLTTLHLKFLVTQGAIDEKLKTNALGMLKRVLKKNRVITTATIDLDPYANNFDSEQLVQVEIESNRKAQSIMIGNAVVLLHNIVRSSSALELLPLDVWLAIFEQLTFTGVEFHQVVNRIVKQNFLV